MYRGEIPSFHRTEALTGVNATSFLNNVTTEMEHARLYRRELREATLEIGGYRSTGEALDDLGESTVIAHIAGGAGTRWDKSFGDSPVYDKQGCLAQLGKPRGLAEVPNLLRHEGIQEDRVPVFIYSLWATKHIPTSQRYIIHAQNATDEELSLMDSWVKKLGLKAEFRPQNTRGGNPKPSGHADAIVQNSDILDNNEYFIPQFVSDASSQSTITDTLLTLHASNKAGIPIDMLAPTTYAEGKYPFFVNEKGLPVKVGHAKLLGENSLISDDLIPAESSVGLYLFLANAIREKIDAVHGIYLGHGERSYAFLHDNLTNEFAIDDVNALIMAEERARLLAISKPREILHSAKTVTELGPFTQMMKEIIDEEKESN